MCGIAGAVDLAGNRVIPDAVLGAMADAIRHRGPDEDGYFHFSSRDDDVIIMARYRIGPFEVESVMATHPSVAHAETSLIYETSDSVKGCVSVIVPHDVGRHPAAVKHAPRATYKYRHFARGLSLGGDVRRSM